MSEKEIRSITIPAKVELREDGEPQSISGYAIVYNKDSGDMGFVERVAPGAATEALKRSDIYGFKNHNPDIIFGRQGVNMTLKEDKGGVAYVATPIDTRGFKDTADEIRAGLLTGQSFGFTILSDEWSDLDKPTPKRTITEIGEIFDVGPVAFPAYPDTTVALRSLEKAKAAVEEKPAFSEPMVVVTFGEETKEFSLNDKGEINRWLEGLTGEPEGEPETKRSELKPTLNDSDIAVDEPTLDKSTDLDTTVERWNDKLKQHGKG